MKKKKEKIDWKVSDELVCWSAVAMIAALLILILSSCKTTKESTVDYEITSSEAYQQRRTEEHERQMAIRQTERRDTVRDTVTRSGKIEIVRDTAGQPVRIIYDLSFNGFRTFGLGQLETERSDLNMERKDSAADSSKQITAEGQTKEKKNAGMGPSQIILWVILIAFMLVLGLGAVIYTANKLWKLPGR